MRRKDTIQEEINRIRLELYEETKDLTVEQSVKRSNDLAEKIAKQYGFRIMPSARKSNMQNLKQD